jgi:SAM-dependent methyltransferase
VSGSADVVATDLDRGAEQYSLAPVDTGRYDDQFYDEIDVWARESAAVIVPWIVDALSPASVLDVGCGRGRWLAAFKDHGVGDVLGLDGDYIDRASVHLDGDEFRSADLLSPPELDRSFDLAMSLEVAEHLPASTADEFVRFLTDAAPVVLFSAAIPGQGGVHHVNEQWPGYWARRFVAVGYRPIDVIRRRYWSDDRVAFFLAQNMIVYARDDLAGDVARRLGTSPDLDADPPALVHPSMLEALREQARVRQPIQPSLSSLLRSLPSALSRAVRRRAGSRRRSD